MGIVFEFVGWGGQFFKNLPLPSLDNVTSRLYWLFSVDQQCWGGGGGRGYRCDNAEATLFRVFEKKTNESKFNKRPRAFGDDQDDVFKP